LKTPLSTAGWYDVMERGGLSILLPILNEKNSVREEEQTKTEKILKRVASIVVSWEHTLQLRVH